MPQAIAAFASWFASYFGAYGTIAYGVAYAVGYVVASIAVGYALGAVMRALTPKPKGMDQGQQLQTKIDPAFPREVIVGLGATGGSIVFENTYGAELEYYVRVICISDYEINQVTKIVVNGQVETFADDIHTGLRACNSNFVEGATAHLHVRVYKGTQDQTADADLQSWFPGMITEEFRGRGQAYVIVRMKYSNSVWPQGMSMFFVAEGAPVYDTRTSVSEYNENPVLIGRQFLKGFYNNGIRVVGMGVADRSLPDADYSAGADECDETIELQYNAALAEEDEIFEEKRYRMGGIISSRETPREVLANICAAMGGKHVDRGGEIVLLPGVWRAPLFDVSESLKDGELATAADAPFNFTARRTADDRANAIVSTFVSPRNAFQEAPLPPRKDAAAIIDDGDRFEMKRAYRYVFSYTQGQRLDQIELRRARKEGFLSYQAPLWGFEMSPGDTHTMTNRRWRNVEKYWELKTLDIAISSGLAGGQPMARTAMTFDETGPDVFEWIKETDEVEWVEPPVLEMPAPLPPLRNDQDRYISSDALPLGSMGGTGLTRTVSYPLSASSSTQIDVAAHDVEYVGVTYELPSASITGLTADTVYWIFYDLVDEAYDAFSSGADVRAAYTSADRYIPVGTQQTQDGGGGYSPPPPPPPGGGGGSSGGGGGGGSPD